MDYPDNFFIFPFCLMYDESLELIAKLKHNEA